jgi:hypothetical protein
VTAKIIARVLLTLGFIAASVGYSAWSAQRTIFDPSATRGATEALLATPTVQTMLAREIRVALRPALGAQKLDPKAAAAIDAAVNDPRFIGAFEAALMDLHESILSGESGQVTLDTSAVTKAINDAVARVDPKLAPKVRKLHAVKVPLGTADMPKVGNARERVRIIGNAAIAIAILLIGGALLLAHDRKTFRRTGRRIAFLAIPTALVFLVLPRVLASSDNSPMAVSAAILEAYGHRVMLSVAVLAIAGISVWLIAIALPGRRKQSDAETTPAAPAASTAPSLLAPSHAPSTVTPADYSVQPHYSVQKARMSGTGSAMPRTYTGPSGS